jgi:hypothetical protein
MNLYDVCNDYSLEFNAKARKTNAMHDCIPAMKATIAQHSIKLSSLVGSMDRDTTKSAHIEFLTSLYPEKFSSSVRPPKARVWDFSMAERGALGLKTWANPYTR